MNDTGSNLRQGSSLQGGKYVIERMLGQGGFGITYMVMQVGLNRRVCIKEFFMKDYCERDSGTSHVTAGSQGSKQIVERFMKKFVKEAQTIAQLDNPHIIKIHDIFRENGTAYYVMEYIDGGSLEEYVNKRKRLDEAIAVDFVCQIADALSYIHSKNILHLDVKPSNLLLRDSGELVLIDFGISKRYDEQGEQSSTTPVGISKGYAPIEQYTQGGVSQFSPCTDVYSLGVVLYKLLTGVRPEEASVLIADELTIPAYVSPHCAAVIRKAMSTKKTNRYRSAAEMKTALCATGLFKVTGGNDTEIEVLTVEDKTEVSINDALAEMFAISKRQRPATATGTIKGHEYVDLGLSVKWATCNVGASSPSEYGLYYAWGETRTKREYTKENSKTHGKNIGDTKGYSSNDAARANWGGSWRLPTKAECRELTDNCNNEWVTQNGVWGCKFTSKKNGKSIFLPAGGYRFGSSLCHAGRDGYYWSCTPNSSDSTTTYKLGFCSGGPYISLDYRYVGLTVRPVSE